MGSFFFSPPPPHAAVGVRSRSSAQPRERLRRSRYVLGKLRLSRFVSSCNLSVLTAQEMFCLEWQREPFIQVQILPVRGGEGGQTKPLCANLCLHGGVVRLFEGSASAADVLSCAALEMLYE